MKYDLKTKYYELFDQDNPLKEYPRPTFIRNSYLSLNGKWQYAITKKNEDLIFDNKEIIVPYVIESYLSNVRYDLKKDETLWYYKKFVLGKEFLKDKIILHLDGIFQISDIYLNGQLLGHNEGGFKKIFFEIQDYIKDENELIVKVMNQPDYDLEVSKEGHKRGGMWYTKTTGIYKPVWIESFDFNDIYDLNIETDIDGTVYGQIESNYQNYHIDVIYKGEIVYKNDFIDGFLFKIDEPKLWSPEEPNIYDIVIDNGYERIKSYFAFRKFDIKENNIYLNGNKIFINGVLNQSYFSDGIYTPATYQAFKDDILLAKKLGFNALRMHLKVENDIFYHLADRLGILIMQDFPNSGKYKFIRDTLLPTIITFLPFGNQKVTKKRKLQFLETGKDIINQMRKHPSVFYITIFNEGWGQFDADKMYQLFKDYCPDFIYDTTSGWFKKKKSDVLSIHNYFYKLKMLKTNKPYILSEYGGYSLRIEDHGFSNKEYGYHKCQNIEELNNDYDKLMETISKLKEEGLAGAVYTQLSDIEDEINGLITYDRKIIKIKRG